MERHRKQKQEKRGDKSQRVSVWGYRLCEEPVEGREVTNSMGNGRVQPSLLGRELSFH